MNKSLEVIQKVSKIAKIVCRVLFVCSVVGASLALLAAIIAATAGTGELFSIGNISVYGLVVTDESAELSKIILILIAAIISLVPTAILMKMAENYFAQELKDGTPFTIEGAERIKKLGIFTLILPFASDVIVQTMIMIAANTSNVEATSGGSIITGLLLIFLHFVFKYGAEISGGSAPAQTAPAETENKEN